MGFFKSSKSHVEVLEADCKLIAEQSTQVRSRCEKSLRGKYENMDPEARAALLKEGAQLARKLHETLLEAREREKSMEQDQCPSEDLLAAHAKVLEAQLDASRADKSLDEAKASLLSSVAEIEQFYGARSPEARHIQKILAELTK